MPDQILPGCSLHRHSMHGDARGKLVALEAMRSVPFDIARVYYLFDTVVGESRGFHAHRDLHQWVVCVSGSCRMTLDDGRERRDVVLDDPETGLHVGPMIWREMHDFTPGTVLLVLASAIYDESDYLRDYDAFLKLAGKAPA